MTKLTYKRITYKELKDGTYKNVYIPQDDKLTVTSHVTSFFRNALIACPCNNDDSKTFMHLYVDEEGKEIGRTIRFGTRIKAGDRVYGAESGCGFEVIEEYRNEGIGADLIMITLQNDEYDFLLGAGLSLKAYPLHRKLKYHLFEVPQYYKVKHARYVFRSLGLRSWWLLGWFFVQKFKDIPNWVKWNKLKKKFVIKKETIIPEWVSEMVENDGHQFMEVHDSAWFQWNLDYNTYGFDQDIQSFYSVLDRNNKPLGFFMTKERLIQKSGPDKGLIRGTVVEWESCDKNVLSEADINLLAIHTFTNNVDVIFTLACESDTAHQLKRMGFRERASFKVSVKDKKKQVENIGDQSLWRLRYGYTNMIIL
jgi:GNAT superfamily N-acetyltransferase